MFFSSTLVPVFKKGILIDNLTIEEINIKKAGIQKIDELAK